MDLIYNVNRGMRSVHDDFHYTQAQISYTDESAQFYNKYTNVCRQQDKVEVGYAGSTGNVKCEHDFPLARGSSYYTLVMLCDTL